MLVWPAPTALAKPLPLEFPLEIDATVELFDEVQVTAWVTSLLALPLA
jgi:hypothetical protein